VIDPSSGGSETTPATDSLPTGDGPPDGTDDEEPWFVVRGRDAALTGTSRRVVHVRREPGGGGVVREWEYGELRSLHVFDTEDGGSLVIEPRSGPLVPIAIAPEEREQAFQSATVLSLLIARAERGAPIPRSDRN
jgi:hypothetical protein